MKELYDKDMREALFSFFEDSCRKIRFLEEFTMGKSRADAIMICEKEIIGFELKSDKDSLVRLKRQILDYDKYYDRNYLVIGEHFAKKAEEVLPDYWGIIKITENNGEIVTEVLRESGVVPKNPLKRQMEFLWRDELVKIIRDNKLGGVSGKNKQKLCKMIDEGIPGDEIKGLLCDAMLEREYPVVYTYIYKNEMIKLTFITDGKEIKRIDLYEYSSRMLEKYTINDNSSLHKEIKKQMDEYFSGKRKMFELPLEKQRFNAFSRKVYDVIKTIPYGETKSYSDVAEEAGKPNAYRAVGMINHKNPYPIIVPCHRVVTANGRLGGYVGGLEMKEMLLSLERTNNEDKNS